jgi:hypothetical protein
MNLNDIALKFQGLLQNGIDPKVFNINDFVANLKSDMTSVVKTSITDDVAAVKQFEAVMEDIAQEISDTLVAMSAETDPDKLAALKQDLEEFIPDQKDAAISALVSQLGSDTQNILDNLWDFLLQTAVTVAKAFVLG